MPDRPTCETCRFWNGGMRGLINGEPEPAWRWTGGCHRHPPLENRVTSMNGDVHGSWPVTSADDWCGEHEPVAGVDQPVRDATPAEEAAFRRGQLERAYEAHAGITIGRSAPPGPMLFSKVGDPKSFNPQP